MIRIGRNCPCPCGSGKKFKKCCLRREMEGEDLSSRRVTSKLAYPLSRPIPELKMKAWAFYQTGYFQDCIDVCEELRLRNAACERVMGLLALSVISISGNDDTLYRFTKMGEGELPHVEVCIGPLGLHPIERRPVELSGEMHEALIIHPVEKFATLLRGPALSAEAFERAITEVRNKIRIELGIIPSAHPTVALLVAEWLLDREVQIDFARELVSCCLGFIYRYKRLDDLMRLARLLNRLRAPQYVWTQLLNLYCDFTIEDDIGRHMMSTSTIDAGAQMLDRKETDWKEGQFHRYCASTGLPEWQQLMDSFFDAIKAATNKECNHFLGSGEYFAGGYLEWVSEDSCQRQHPWYCLLNSVEKDFLRNGDTAFATCVTTDFSLACSQWWRCIESVLRRKLIVPVGQMLDEHPEWVKQDGANSYLEETESLFVRDLASANRRTKLSLTQMLMILEKCMSDCRKNKRSDSIVRAKTVEHVSNRLSDFRWVSGEQDSYSDLRSAYTPGVLSEQSIRVFRNAASHDEPMTFVQAAVGRLLAIRILDFMHYPRYCVTEKRDELKRELSETRGNLLL
jgi:hypothetical protein